MAIPSSGSVTLLQIQQERGGPTPIQLGNYYFDGSFRSQNTSFVVVSPTINGASVNTTFTTGLPGKTVTHTTVNHNLGFKHSSLAVSGRPTVGQAGVTTPSVTTQVDNVGNAGTIPFSGSPIQMDHFRGTSSGVQNTHVIWGIEYHTASTSSLGTSSANWFVYFQGHLGTNNQGNTAWDGLPFVTLQTIATGNPAVPASTFRFDALSSSGGVGAKVLKSHLTNSTIGNYTQCQFSATSTAYRHSTSNSTWQVTCNV